MKIEKIKPEKLKDILNVYDENIDKLVSFMRSSSFDKVDGLAEKEDLVELDKVVKIMKELPSLIRNRESLCELANGNTIQVKSGKTENDSIFNGIMQF
jgi:hypothetical protein